MFALRGGTFDAFTRLYLDRERLQEAFKTRVSEGREIIADRIIGTKHNDCQALCPCNNKHRAEISKASSIKYSFRFSTALIKANRFFCELKLKA